MSNFSFDDKNFLQIHGTVMGSKMAPSYANLFLARFEISALTHAPHKPHIWWLYMDDIFMVWTYLLEDLDAFTTHLTGIHATIKSTWNRSFTSIPFLDVNVSIINGKIITDLSTKPTDKHQHLLHSSCHTTHTERAILSSLDLRSRRIFSADETFTFHSTNS